MHGELRHPVPMWTPVTYCGSLAEQHGTWRYAGLCACDCCLYEARTETSYVLAHEDGHELVHVGRGSFHSEAGET